MSGRTAVARWAWKPYEMESQDDGQKQQIRSIIDRCQQDRGATSHLSKIDQVFDFGRRQRRVLCRSVGKSEASCFACGQQRSLSCLRSSLLFVQGTKKLLRLPPLAPPALHALLMCMAALAWQNPQAVRRPPPKLEGGLTNARCTPRSSRIHHGGEETTQTTASDEEIPREH